MTVTIEEVKKLVREAGEAVMEVYNRDNFSVDSKDDGSPVTEADILADSILYSGLKKYGWPVLSEEFKDSHERLDSDYVWIIDPIDGTRGFVSRNGQFAIMVGLAYKGNPVMGVIYAPVTNHMYFAELGKGTHLDVDGEITRMQVSDLDQLSEARAIVSLSSVTERIQDVLDRSQITKLSRAYGVGIKIGEMIAGGGDIYFTYVREMGQWDACAPHIILEEAGGKMTGIFGEKITYNGADPRNRGAILATNGALHEEILEHIIALRD